MVIGSSSASLPACRTMIAPLVLDGATNATIVVSRYKERLVSETQARNVVMMMDRLPLYAK
jgi:hypothetical protein